MYSVVFSSGAGELLERQAVPFWTVWGICQGRVRRFMLTGVSLCHEFRAWSKPSLEPAASCRRSPLTAGPGGQHHSKHKAKQPAENKVKAKPHCQEIESWNRGWCIPLLEEQPQLVQNDKSQDWVRHLWFKGVMVPEAEMEAQQSLCSPALSTTAEEGVNTT